MFETEMGSDKVNNLNNIDIAMLHARQMYEECLRLQEAAQTVKDAKEQGEGWSSGRTRLSGIESEIQSEAASK
ncbi:hypothetical protein GCM10010917_09570 [Paenibacillus physcomitrellae]|uniref:Uncharacterized protein n=1 Tax=Paenibacillus physcomitrellae TaxID=1619311 RepID=A0ABQ1FQL4_9BACL|nr:hypothetical protein GCM10010917_09570 [Paenibacillus physcomitrellae]